MPTTYTLDDYKKYHQEAVIFFASQLMILKEVIPKITDDKLSKAAVLLISCGQTGAAIHQLSSQVQTYTNESLMLARGFIEKIINFCYIGISDEKVFKAFMFHPIYKHFHNVGRLKLENGITKSIRQSIEKGEQEQKELKKTPIVQEALEMFSETNPRMNWTKKTLQQRIKAIEKSKKLMDFFFTISKLEYYSDASEVLHGSLYGSTFSLDAFNFDFMDKLKNPIEIEKKLFKDNACVLLQLGMLIHESLTLISYTSEIKELWKGSYDNRGLALNLLFHILEIDIENIDIKQW